MKADLDARELARYAVTLDRAAEVAPAETRKVVTKGALNIKTSARRRAGGLKHAPAYPRSITYDTRETATSASADIGPDKGKRQGALGNILEYGTLNNEPIPHMGPAADEEQPRFERAMADLAERTLR